MGIFDRGSSHVTIVECLFKLLPSYAVVVFLQSSMMLSLEIPGSSIPPRLAKVAKHGIRARVECPLTLSRFPLLRSTDDLPDIYPPFPSLSLPHVPLGGATDLPAVRQRPLGPGRAAAAAWSACRSCETGCRSREERCTASSGPSSRGSAWACAARSRCSTATRPSRCRAPP